MSDMQPVLIAGKWQRLTNRKSFQAYNPRTTEPLPDSYPISSWEDIETALHAAAAAFAQLRRVTADRIASFLERFAERIEGRRLEIVSMAERETAYPAEPRLNSVELPRTADQLRQAAAAARDRGWTMPTIDSAKNIRSMFRPIGPVCVFGPNNFPLAFNSIAGGDFAAAIAAGCPVIAKANTSHPGTSRLLAEEAFGAVNDTGMPAGLVQLLYRTDHKDGERLVAHSLLGATAYTGSRSAGLALKSAADRGGKPIYLELSSINPVVILPGALRERLAQVADEFLSSALMGTGQFCTNPGVVLLLAGEPTKSFIQEVANRYRAAPVGTLLSSGVQNSLADGVKALQSGGAQIVAGGEAGGGQGFCYRNTLLTVSGGRFLKNAELLQTEAFGNVSLFVVAEEVNELARVIDLLEGNLTGCIYSHRGGEDDDVYAAIEPLLRQHVGRLLNDKMPTGVAVSPAMNHGGPYPATGHPGFTAVGIPASLRRFAMLACYDNVREPRLPPELRDKNPTGKLSRLIGANWTQENVTSK
jgi:NADP-dependent aldehyde dehydrogenase